MVITLDNQLTDSARKHTFLSWWCFVQQVHPTLDPCFHPDFQLVHSHRWTQHARWNPDTCVANLKYQLYIIELKGDWKWPRHNCRVRNTLGSGKSDLNLAEKYIRIFLASASLVQENNIKPRIKKKRKKGRQTGKRAVNNYPFCPSLTTLSSSPSLVLIHFTPCSCGSIISGHLSQFVRMVAFSVLMRSLGRFSLFHCAIVALSVNKVRGSRFSVILIGTWRIQKTRVNTLITRIVWITFK